MIVRNAGPRAPENILPAQPWNGERRAGGPAASGLACARILDRRWLVRRNSRTKGGQILAVVVGLTFFLALLAPGRENKEAGQHRGGGQRPNVISSKFAHGSANNGAPC